MLDIGDLAPDFTSPSDLGGNISLKDCDGPVVLYFYPRDDTPGCTKEAQGFTQSSEAFAAAGAFVLGVSKDTLAKHAKFRAKYELGVHLLSDAEGDLCERYGVWGEKKMYGKTFMGIERATFLIGRDKRIKAIWRKVKVPGHVEEVLAAVQAL